MLSIQEPSLAGVGPQNSSLAQQASKAMSDESGIGSPKNGPVCKTTEMMGKNKERFRRLAQPSDKAAHSQNVSALNGQLTDVASEIYKIYVQDS